MLSAASMRSKASKTSSPPTKFYKSIWFVIFASVFSFCSTANLISYVKTISSSRSFKPPRRWLVSLRDTNHHPQCFPRDVVNHKIGTHAKGAGPRDFLFDEFGNGERYAEFFACREALAGCRGAALTRMFGVPTVWREYKHVSCPDSAAVFVC